MKSPAAIALECLPRIDACVGSNECSMCMGDNAARTRIVEAIITARLEVRNEALRLVDELQAAGVINLRAACQLIRYML